MPSSGTGPSENSERMHQSQELQIDFDCPSARLAGYVIWVKELRSAFPQTPLAITVLPDWLAQRDFAALAKAAGRFVLQVHSVPGISGAAPVLCDGKLARQAIERAGRFGVPFRVALPTYSCELRADSSGRIVGVHAEDSQPAAESATLVLRADAAEMAISRSRGRIEDPAGPRR